MPRAMRRRLIGSLVFTLTLGASVPLLAQSGSADSAQHDAMGQDSMKHDAMAKDKMAPAPHGAFIDAGGHKATGTAELVTKDGKSRLELSDDFSVEKGPDIYVVLSPSAAMAPSGTQQLGKVKHFSGAQTFDVPAGVDVSTFTHVVLWCKKFDVLMGTAELAAGDATGM